MPEGPEEQLEFLRREDIRTMAKDMARLREEEAKKERERIIQLQGKNKKQQDQPVAIPVAVKEHPQIPFTPSGINLPKPPSRAKKIFARVAVVFLILFTVANVIALIYSFTPIRSWIQNY
ncbi:MAG: hypothetical protein HYT40_03695 [Candidatus Sungbacteria bacterium]|uniref:Uncharacterized protein n=1 Tax=Candidatus Sungiibacteriota bacterium TaxID=2750080 RepID=A0A931SDR5_9BACT|nr:hypothetical protein [Candidatus Sungbacteria bacterium]